FKVVGGRYGEFLDFDENTASRAKLDVARIKIATRLRGNIDDPLKIKALGVLYTIWVVEDKSSEPVFNQGSRVEEQEYSWVGTSNFPAEAMVELEVATGGSVEEEMVNDGVDLQSGHVGEHGEKRISDGDGSLVKEASGQPKLLVSACILEATKGKSAQKDFRPEGFVGAKVSKCGTQDEKVGEGDSCVGLKSCDNGVKEMCLTWGREEDIGGSLEIQVPLNGRNIRSTLVPEPNRTRFQPRSTSLPPFRVSGQFFDLGLRVENGLDYSDSISQIEVRGGVHISSDKEEEYVSQRPISREKIPKKTTRG
ncbi:DUF4283 domain protein, partial [Trifolium medium]|nr:DUF4283 domain protein [Trifolium medium]